jgi:signal transduction histidine kinase
LSGEDFSALAAEQAALRRVATRVARGAAPTEVFGAITEEVGRLLPVDFANMGRCEPDATMTFLAAWGKTSAVFPVGTRMSLGGKNVTTVVARTGRPARVESYADASGPIGDAVLGVGARSAVGSPITVDGRIWGVMAAGSVRQEPMPADIEARLTQFTELLATAIANAESRERVGRLAEEQAALRRVATLVARGAAQAEVFATVIEEAGRLLRVDLANLCRYEPDGTQTFVATWGRGGKRFAVGTRRPLGGRNLGTLVFETGRPARIDSYRDASGSLSVTARDTGLHSAVATPIVVEGRLWGMMGVGSSQEGPLPADTDARLASFTELVATAIANAESRAALAASRARIVAAADQTRRRIERDLHDGIQQRLVSLVLELRMLEATEPADVVHLRARLAWTARELGALLEELQEIARGIHPPALSRGGLDRALRVLGRRSSIPVEVDLRIDRRLPEQVEVAAYYVVSEALTNAAKHAQASAVSIDLVADDIVARLAIHDDGVGGADPSQGSGLVGLSDRIDALGGAFRVKSPAGGGTTLLIEIPLEGHTSIAPAVGP